MATNYTKACNDAIKHHELRAIKLGAWLFRWTPFTPIARILIKRHQRFADALSDVRWTEERLANNDEGYGDLCGFDRPEDCDEPGSCNLLPETMPVPVTSDYSITTTTPKRGPTKILSYKTNDGHDLDIAIPVSKKITKLDAAAWVIEQLERNLEHLELKAWEKAKKKESKASKKTTKKERTI